MKAVERDGLRDLFARRTRAKPPGPWPDPSPGGPSRSACRARALVAVGRLRAGAAAASGGVRNAQRRRHAGISAPASASKATCRSTAATNAAARFVSDLPRSSDHNHAQTATKMTFKKAIPALLLCFASACDGCGGSNPGTTCGNARCESGERCETCPKDCGVCNVCGDGKCSVTEVENCQTCPKDCACPEILTCARELTLPPRCVLPTTAACPDGQSPQPYTFCLVAPGKRIDDCANRFESLIQACTKDQARAVAQNGAANYTLQDGPCPPCCASPPCH